MTRLVLLSGFLGAGKTTLMLAAAETLRKRGMRVACITNDQASRLVDSNMVLRHALPLRQIEGGCFCCRFDELVESIRGIVAEAKPDVVIAEAVGSCTDLAATVVKPLQAYYAAEIEISPLTVVVDPERWMDFSGEADHPFTQEIMYLYRKQLEEANCIVLNKIDLLTSEQLQRVGRELRREHPHADVFPLTAHQAEHIGQWLDHILANRAQTGPSMEVDYNTYGVGESQLGWLNASVRAVGYVPDVPGFCSDLAERVAEQLRLQHAEIAHLKIWAQDSRHSIKLSLVRNARLHRVDYQTAADWSADALTLWINARAHSEAGVLQAVVESGLQAMEHRHAVAIHIDEMDCFAPGRPTPVHRIS